MLLEPLIAEVDASTLATVAAVVTPVLAFFGRWVVARDEKRSAALADCEKRHAADQYRIGGLEASVRLLSEQHGGEVQKQVDTQLSVSAAQAEAAVQKPPPK